MPLAQSCSHLERPLTLTVHTMLRKTFDSSRRVALSNYWGATMRLVLVPSTRTQHVAGKRYSRWKSLHIGRSKYAWNARQPRIFLQMH
jgi:hypothetical protein